MNTAEELKSAILRMDHRGYPAYKSLAGSWRFPEYILNIDYVQGDPFASPSSLSVRIEGKRAGFPAAFLENKARRRALEVLSGGGRTVPSLAMPRAQEIFACVSRYRGLRF